MLNKKISLSLITFDSLENEVRSKLPSEYLVRVFRLQLNFILKDREELDFNIYNSFIAKNTKKKKKKR